MKFLQCLLIMFIGFFINAQSPEFINYQAVARDNNGDLIKNYSLIVKACIQNDINNPNCIYEEYFDVETNELGLFSLSIGDGNSTIGSFNDIKWGQYYTYLNIQLDLQDGNGFVDMGTTSFNSVPYALYAKESGSNIWAKNSSGISYNDGGNVGIGIENALRGFHMRGQNSVLRLDRSKYAPALFLFKYAPGTTEWDDSDYESGFGLGVSTELIPEYIDSPYFYIGEDVDKNYSTGWADNGVRFIIKSGGNTCVGCKNPTAKFQVSEGDVYVEDINSGIILRSPDGNCWRVQVQNDGNFINSSIECPN